MIANPTLFPALAPDSVDDHGPKWDLHPGDIVTLGRLDAAYARTLKVKGRIAGSNATPFRSAKPSYIHFEEIPDGSSVFQTDKELSFLAKAGEFQIGVLNEDPSKPRETLPTALSLTDEEHTIAKQKKKYVDACLAQQPGYQSSRRVLNPVIRALAAKLGETAPSFSTVQRDMDKWRIHGGVYGIASLAPKRRSGNRKRPWTEFMLRSLRNCVIVLSSCQKGGAEDALSMLRVYIDEQFPETKDAVRLPSLRTVEREFQRIDKFIKDVLRKKRGHAARKHGAYYERPCPALPLEEVEVDHTTFDIQLIDDESSLVFGRPDVVTIRCRRTGMMLGIGIGWEVPSYAAFLEAVRHAFYEKDLTAFPNVKTGWPCRGRFKRVYVDNALHFIGLNIQHAANELNFEILEFRPGEPWLKGADERLYGILNLKVVHLSPGTTMSNVAERKEYAEALELPALTLKEFEAFLVGYICDEFHWQKHDGLGPLRTLPDVPIRLWKNEIGSVKIRDLPHPDTFAALAGDVDERTVQHYGIEWDHIIYQHEDLIQIRIHPEHKEGRGRHRGTRYRVTRDPQDLGQIWVFDPYRKTRIEVPAVRADYAAGLTLHQHRVIVAHHQRTVGAFVDIDGLLRTRGAMLVQIERLRKARVSQGIERKLARFLGKQTQKRLRSTVETKNDSRAASADPLDIENPIGLIKPEMRAKRAPNLNRRGAEGNRERVRPVRPAGARALPMQVDRGECAAQTYQNAQSPEARSKETTIDMDALKRQHGWEGV
jgi:putative transposase